MKRKCSKQFYEINIADDKVTFNKKVNNSTNIRKCTWNYEQHKLKPKIIFDRSF